MAAAKRVLRYLCSTSGMGLVLGGRRPVVLTGHADASWADDHATQRSSQGYTFSLGSGSISWRSTRSSSVRSSSCEAEIYAGAMAAQELRWLTYLLTDLGEQPRSPPVLYVDNKAMLALCGEHRLEHRTKHIALRYFLARELQQRGQLRLAYVASQANTTDIFTKALAPGDHQGFCTMLAFSIIAYLITHLCSLDASYHVSCTITDIHAHPNPMRLTLYIFATCLPNRLASARNTLLALHPMHLTINLFSTALTDVETRLRAIVSTTAIIVPPINEGYAPPQPPTTAASAGSHLLIVATY
ncbi:unnamed protein product [Closterium sp. NIES-54]